MYSRCIRAQSATTLKDDSKNTYILMNSSLSPRKQLFALMFNPQGHFVGVIEQERPGIVRRFCKKAATIIQLLFSVKAKQSFEDQPSENQSQSIKWGLGK